MFDVSKKTIVITGGAGVLGSTIAKELAKLGAKIAVLDLNFCEAEKIVQEINDNKGTAIAIECNVLEKESIEKAREKIISTFGRIDVLLNAAGGNNPRATTSEEFFGENIEGKDFFSLDKKDIGFVFDLNILGTILPSQVFGKEMNNGVIINFSSMSALRPLTKVCAYSAAKAAVSNFTQWLSYYLAKKNVRVNAIAPGFFLTKQNKFLLLNEKEELTERGKKIIAHTPMGKFGKDKDLLGAIIWLISEESSFVTGITLPIDGGFSAYCGV
jgi:NAD(P)-dependent dehydrogenase (short-subunit alcohol dehydrogenase family)